MRRPIVLGVTSIQVPPDYATTLRRLSVRLREARRAHGLTQEQLAERAGVHRNTIQNLEAEPVTRTPAFRLDVVLAVAHALGIRACDVFVDP